MAQMPRYDTGEDDLIARASALLHSEFNHDTNNAAVVCCMAPGRVNLIGEHTDYNEGFVMPLALKLRTVVVAVPTTSGVCRIASMNQPGKNNQFNTTEIAPGAVHGWGKYVAGVVAQYKAEMPTDEQFSFDAVFASNVPLGAGLSSSASLEVCTATLVEVLLGLNDANGLKRNSQYFEAKAVSKALRCVEAEHVYAGVPCGIMDQFVSAGGLEDYLLLIDCRSDTAIHVPFVDKDVSIVVCNSNVKHSLDGSEYPTRVKQCKQALEAIKQLLTIEDTECASEMTHLRDVTLEMLEKAKDAGLLTNPLAYKRALHVVTENARTVAASEALFKHDYAALGKLMVQSHKSLSDDFEVSTVELNALVAIALSVDGVFGSRMTGGGFGGSTVTLVKTDQVESLMAAFETEYNNDNDNHVAFSDGKCRVRCSYMSTRPGVGSKVIWDRRVGGAAADADSPILLGETATSIEEDVGPSDSPVKSSGSSGSRRRKPNCVIC